MRDPEGKIWSIGPQQYDHGPTPVRWITIKDSYGDQLEEPLLAPAAISRFPDHELADFAEPAVWFQADTRRTDSDKLSAVIRHQPKWISAVVGFAEAGAANHVGFDNLSPLLLAIELNKSEVIPFLLSIGAQPRERVQVRFGVYVVPFDLALSKNRVEILLAFASETDPKLALHEDQLQRCLDHFATFPKSDLPPEEREEDLAMLVQKLRDRLKPSKWDRSLRGAEVHSDPKKPTSWWKK